MCSLDFTTSDYQELQEKLVSAARKMKHDGWWPSEEQLPGRNKIMRVNLIAEMARSIFRVPRAIAAFCTEIMQRKQEDHLASHSNSINQVFHLLSSTTFIYCYFIAVSELTRAMTLGLAALFVRQFGHAILEPPCHDKEKALLGFDTRKKSIIVAAYVLTPITHLIWAGSSSWDSVSLMMPAIARQWFLLTLAAVFGRVIFLIWEHDFRTAMIWL